MSIAAVIGSNILLPVAANAADVSTGTVIPVTIQNDVVGDEGAAISYTVNADVKDASGKVVIPMGSVATGTVTKYLPSAGFGGPSKTVASLDQITTPDGTKIPVKAKATKYGHDTRFASIFFLGLWGYFAKGGSGKVGTGTTFRMVVE